MIEQIILILTVLLFAIISKTLGLPDAIRVGMPSMGQPLIKFTTRTGGKDQTKKSKNKSKKKDKIKDLDAAPRSKSEAAVIKIAEQIIGCPMPTVNPSWLTWRGRTLELDGYCAEKNIALEFSGPLHTKWFPQKEEYPLYFNRVIKDKVKKTECAKADVCLIVIDMRLPPHHWRDYIQSRLYDFDNSVYFRPAKYIDEQVVEPYRNPELEKELSLVE